MGSTLKLRGGDCLQFKKYTYDDLLTIVQIELNFVSCQFPDPCNLYRYVIAWIGKAECYLNCCSAIFPKIVLYYS